MIKAFVTDAVVSKGYNGQDALKYSEDGKSVRFRIGKKVDDEVIAETPGGEIKLRILAISK